jgi:hypothetical protein
MLYMSENKQYKKAVGKLEERDFMNLLCSTWNIYFKLSSLIKNLFHVEQILF